MEAVSIADEVSDPPQFAFRIFPQTLPAKGVSVRMSLKGWYRDGEGKPVGALRSLRFEGDRQISLHLDGVPECQGLASDVRRDLDEMEELCGDAAIGRGRLTFEAFFPGDRWIRFSEKMTVYNLGPKSRGADLLAFAYFPAPVTTALGIPIEIRRLNRGPFGWEARASIPKIAGGYGRITEYSLKIDKRFLSATCRGGKLEMRVVSGFFDRARRKERATRRCSVPKLSSYAQVASSFPQSSSSR